MQKLGYEIIQNEKMQTGFYCDYGEGKETTLAVRCDLDALPIHEINSVDYRSENLDVSHACGHDSHMANILGLASFIKETVSGGVQSTLIHAESMYEILKELSIDKLYRLPEGIKGNGF